MRLLLFRFPLNSRIWYETNDTETREQSKFYIAERYLTLIQDKANSFSDNFQSINVSNEIDREGQGIRTHEGDALSGIIL